MRVGFETFGQCFAGRIEMGMRHERFSSFVLRNRLAERREAYHVSLFFSLNLPVSHRLFTSPSFLF
jgi:hypothetical protein